MIETPFRARFELLADTGQVSREAIEATLQVIATIEQRYGLHLTEDNAAMFVTHIVMAFERLLRGEDLHEVPAAVLEEVAPYQETRAFVAETVYTALHKHRVQVPDTEISYLTLHLAAIQQGDGQS